MKLRQISMDVHMPVTDGPKKKPSINRLSDNLNWLMNRHGIEAAELCRRTGIKSSTMNDWIKNKNKAQVADLGLFKLARYFKVSVEWLCFGQIEEYEESN